MSRADDAEVATVEGRDFGGVEPLCRGDHRRVHGAEWQVAVLGDELGDADRVAGVQRLDREGADGEITEEANLRLPAEPGADQVDDLGDDERGEDERTCVGFEQLQAGGVMGVVGVDVGVEGASVEDQRDGAISEARISSIRSETSLWPLRPAAAAPSCRRPPTPRCCSSAVRVTSAIVTPRRSASWRSRASRSSGSFTVVRRMGMPAYQEAGARNFELKSTKAPGRCARTSASRWSLASGRATSGARVIDRRERRTSSGLYRAPNMSSRRIARTTSPSMLQ